MEVMNGKQQLGIENKEQIAQNVTGERVASYPLERVIFICFKKSILEKLQKVNINDLREHYQKKDHTKIRSAACSKRSID